MLWSLGFAVIFSQLASLSSEFIIIFS